LLVGRADRGQVPQDKHIMGTHRMALDSDHGPCNPYGRYWAFDNLYHAGGGLFVSAPGYNVTHTIWALAYWVAAGILSGADQKQSYTSADIDANWDGLLASIRNLDGDTMAARALAQHASA
jgi:choline dehydrogenase-like flavoprotein